jgi:hypothetical protein
MWSGDGRSLYYVSDRGGVENIWTRPAAAGGTDRALTTFKDGRVLWPTATADGRVIAFERDFGILDAGHGVGTDAPQSLSRVAARPPARQPERVRQTNAFDDLALSADGRKVAFVARGDLFAASVKDGGGRRACHGDGRTGVAAGVVARQPAARYVSTSVAGQRIYVHDFAER